MQTPSKEPESSSMTHEEEEEMLHDISKLQEQVQQMSRPQTVEALQPKLMVMSSPRYPKVGFTFDQEIFETPEAPHHSSICIEDQSNTQISLPPLELHDPIAHALEESYTASTLVQRKWYTFLMFSCISHLRECIHLTSTCSATQHHGKSTVCMSCVCTHLCSVDTFKPGVCLASLLYFSCLLVCIAMLFMNHSFTNMG